MANVVIHIGYDISFIAPMEDVGKIFALFEKARPVNRRWVGNNECWVTSDKPLVRAETLTNPVYSEEEYKTRREEGENVAAEV